MAVAVVAVAAVATVAVAVAVVADAVDGHHPLKTALQMANENCKEAHL